MSDSLLGIPLLRPVVGLKVKDLKPVSRMSQSLYITQITVSSSRDQ